MTKRCLVTIPAWGDNSLTHAVVPDVLAESDLVDLLVVDNSGHYEPVSDEWVIRPPNNIGWARASNLGFRTAFSHGYANAVTLNNDTRLSTDFFAGLLDDRLPADIGIVGPMYDDNGTVPAQTSRYQGNAAEYPPADFCRRVLAIDGTALMITADAWRAVGDLDYRSFGRFTWGAEMDLAIRVREAGFGVYITERSFLNHQGKASAPSPFSRMLYNRIAMTGFQRGMHRLHGPRSIKEIQSAPSDRIALDANTARSRRR